MKWTQKPIPDEVITCVKDLAESEIMPLLDKRELIFEWTPGQRFGPLPNIMTDENTDDDDIADGDDNKDYILIISERTMILMMMTPHIIPKYIILSTKTIILTRLHKTKI